MKRRDRLTLERFAYKRRREAETELRARIQRQKWQDERRRLEVEREEHEQLWKHEVGVSAGLENFFLLFNFHQDMERKARF